MELRNASAYHEALRSRSTPPEGFRFGACALDFFPQEREVAEPLSMSLSTILLDRPTSSFAGLFTQNAFPGAPVTVAKERMKRDTVGGVLVNNRIANVCAPNGEADARRIAGAFAAQQGLPEDSIIPASTGIIGWRLPVEPIIGSLGDLSGRVGTDGPYDVARAIMTTDAFPKLRSAKVGKGRIVGVAKGAGMIEPNMATLLVFVFTDVRIDREPLEQALRKAMRNSFNLISIDSDQSTSDMAIILSSNKKPSPEPRVFQSRLDELCSELALDVVRNGEGTEHVIRVIVTSAPTEAYARGCAKAVVNSPLVKTAVSGNDPNVGRIVMALGDFAGSTPAFKPSEATISIGGNQVFANGLFRLDPGSEKSIADYLESRYAESIDYPRHERIVEIEIDLGSGARSGSAVGSDLSHGYVTENADYRS